MHMLFVVLMGFAVLSYGQQVNDTILIQDLNYEGEVIASWTLPETATVSYANGNCVFTLNRVNTPTWIRVQQLSMHGDVLQDWSTTYVSYQNGVAFFKVENENIAISPPYRIFGVVGGIETVVLSGPFRVISNS